MPDGQQGASGAIGKVRSSTADCNEEVALVSVISFQPSAISVQRSAFSFQLSAFSFQLSAYTRVEQMRTDDQHLLLADS
jgi:hypothetical protein